MKSQMSEQKQKPKDNVVLLAVIAATVVVVAIVAGLWAASTFQGRYSPFEPRESPFTQGLPVPGDIEFFYTVETVVSAVNVALSMFLLLMYFNIYRKTRSEFTVGLIIFSLVLLLQSFVSIPLVHRAFGFYDLGLGPFAMLPSLFTCLALVVLIYLTFEY